MIEVDGLMAAVIPTPTASSPSADAPAEFAAAMALVGREPNEGGEEPGVGPQLAAELVDTQPPIDIEALIDADAPVNVDALVDAEAPVNADGILGADPLLASKSPDGREIDLSSLAVVVPAPDSVPAASGPLAALIPDAGEVPMEEVEVSAPMSVESTADLPTTAPPSATEAPVATAPSVPTEAALVAAEGESAPAVDATESPEAAGDPLVLESVPAKGTPVPAAAPIQSASDVVTNDRTPEVEAAAPEAQAAATPDPAVTAGAAPVAPSPATLVDRIDAAVPELAIQGIDAPTTPSTTETPAATIDIATAAPEVTPTADTSTPTVQPSAVSAPAPRADVTVADVAELPSQPTPAAEATPTQQVAEALREVRRLADGSHRLSLQLHPEELGAVQLEIAIRDGQLHVRAVAETDAARLALEQNLPELRSDLRDAGVRAGSLEVGPDASGRDRSDSPTRDSRTQARGESVAEENPTTTPESSTSSGLDIRL